MPKFETGPSPESTKEEEESLEQVQDVEKKPVETKDVPSEVKKSQIVEKIKAKQQEASALAVSNESTLKSLNKIRSKLGQPPDKDIPPSITSNTEKIEKLGSEIEELARQKEDIEKQLDKNAPEASDSSKGENVLVREEKEDELTVQDINVGDEVYYKGRKWRVFDIGKPSISEETDTDFNYRMLSQQKDPNKEPRKKVKNYGSLTLTGTDGAYRDFRGGPTFKDVEKITPENRERIEKMIKDIERY